MNTSSFSQAELANILAVPRRIFEEVSKRDGEGAKGEREFQYLGNSTYRVRPLASYGLYCAGGPCETVAGAIQYSSGVASASVVLLDRMPLVAEDFSGINPSRPADLLTIGMAKQLMRDYGPDYGKDYKLIVNVATPFMKGLSIVEYGRYLPTIIAMLERLRDLPAELPFVIRERAREFAC